MFPAIVVLKYKTQSAGSRASEMVHNDSRFSSLNGLAEGCTPPAYPRSSSFGRR